MVKEQRERLFIIEPHFFLDNLIYIHYTYYIGCYINSEFFMIYGAATGQTLRQARRNGGKISPIFLERFDLLSEEDPAEERYQRFLIDLQNLNNLVGRHRKP